MPKDKKGQQKVQMLKKTTVLCPSMSYITVHMLQVLAESFAPLWVITLNDAGVGRKLPIWKKTTGLSPSMSYYCCLMQVLAAVSFCIANIAKDKENLAVITDHGVIHK